MQMLGAPVLGEAKEGMPLSPVTLAWLQIRAVLARRLYALYAACFFFVEVHKCLLHQGKPPWVLAKWAACTGVGMLLALRLLTTMEVRAGS